MTVSAFYNPINGAIVITGKNDSGSEQKFEGILKNLSGVKNFKYYLTDATHNFYRGADIQVDGHTFSQVIPAFSVFTFAGNSRK